MYLASNCPISPLLSDVSPPRLDIAGEVSFASWLAAGRRGVPTTTNQPAGEMPFQRWLKVKEAFAPQFVVETLSQLPRRPASCLDPFGGSGTTALTCQFLGIEPTTIEVNPFMADLIESKLCPYEWVGLSQDFASVIRQARAGWNDCPEHVPFDYAPKTFVEPGVAGRWLFSAQTAKAIQALAQAIDGVADPTNQRLLRVVLGSCLIRLSNVVVNGKGRRYRGSWQKRQSSPEQAFTEFEVAGRRALLDIKLFVRRRTHGYTLLRGDTRELIPLAGKADVILFSPPYPNSFDYTDIYNIELWVLGYLKSSQANRHLRANTLRSHVQIKHVGEVPPALTPTLAKVYRKLTAKRRQMWNPHIPEMICLYFKDMERVVAGCRNVIAEGGYTILAVGDSCYEGVVVDVPKILVEIAATLGFRCVKSEAVRSMRSSAQQGGENDLNESLLWLRAE